MALLGEYARFEHSYRSTPDTVFLVLHLVVCSPISYSRKSWTFDKYLQF